MKDLSLLTFALIFAGSVAHSEERPNIVFLLADDLGWTGLGCFGSDFYETPHLDKMAAEGMKFTHAYAACTVCSPSRASVMTGQYPARLHLTDFIPGQDQPTAKLKIPDWQKGLLHDDLTVAEGLREKGYRTGMVGKWHLERRDQKEEDAPVKHGFDVEYLKPAGGKGYYLSKNVQNETGRTYLTDYLTDKAIKFIEESSSAPEPFFLYMAYHVPHTPIQGREDLVEKFTKKVDPSSIHHNPIYAAMVASLDQSAGRILGSLEKAGVSDNTLVVFTSDNGGLTQRYGVHDGFTENIPLRRGKGSSFEGGVRVPAIVKWPKVIAPGSVSETPIMTIDYCSTFLSAAGARLTTIQDGIDLIPVFNDSTATIDRDLFWHYPHYHAGGDGPYSAIRSGNYRLTESFDSGQISLYNLDEDIGESRDLASLKPEVTKALHTKLSQWREKVGAQMPTPNSQYDPTQPLQKKKRGKSR